jgi:tRNA threonylcarbamoyladenosine biosynthesis protein TsaB
MKTLALEFASDRRGVAVVVDGEPRGAAAETGGRNTRALTLIEQALREARIEREAIETIAVGLGPGSYAGIRAAISTAQGWQLARGVRLIGISTVDCLIAQAQACGIEGTVHIAIDAQRGEFYLASYEMARGEHRLVEALRLATAEEVSRRSATDVLLIWPESQALLSRGQVLLPDAAMLGQLASRRADFVAAPGGSGEKLEPIYLRAATFVKAAPPRLIPIL